MLSGYKEKNALHSEGMALMLCKEMEKALIECIEVNSGITKTFRTTTMKVMQRHALQMTD